MLVRLYRLGEFALNLECTAQLTMCVQEHGLNSDRLAERLLRGGEVALDRIGRAEVGQDISGLWLQREATEIAVDGFVEALLFESRDSERGPALGMVGTYGEESAIAHLGVRKSAGPLMFPGCLEIVHDDSLTHWGSRSGGATAA